MQLYMADPQSRELITSELQEVDAAQPIDETIPSFDKFSEAMAMLWGGKALVFCNISQSWRSSHDSLVDCCIGLIPFLLTEKGGQSFLPGKEKGPVKIATFIMVSHFSLPQTKWLPTYCS